jgi:AcrR family transcriptional regulator
MNVTAYNRPKQPEQVRRALLDAAVALAEEQGLGGITVQAVAPSSTSCSKRWKRRSTG